MAKQVLITGASEGIGRAFAKAFAESGYSVIGVARNQARLDSLAAELQKTQAATQTHRMVAADLSTEAGIQKVIEVIRATELDTLINNAGIGVLGPLAKTDVQKQVAMLRLNMEALTVLSHAFIQKAARGSTLINVASTASFQPIPLMGTYAGTKSYVTSVSEALAFELRDRDIYVLAVCPGPVATEFGARIGIEDRKLEKYAQRPESVVRESMAAFRKRKKTVLVTGLPNRIVRCLQRFVPRCIEIRLSAMAFRPYYKD